jgi:hypothetical protein
MGKISLEKTLLSAVAKDEIVRVLGIEVANVRMSKLHIKVNGVDLMQDIVLDELQITADIEQPVESKAEVKKVEM